MVPVFVFLVILLGSKLGLSEILMNDNSPGVVTFENLSELKNGENRYENIKIEEKNLFYDRIINEAPHIPGNICEFIPTQEIPWLRPELLRNGSDFIEKNFFSIFTSHAIGLFYLLSVKSVTAVLLQSGKFYGESNAFRRVISTAARVHSWYAGDLMSNNSRAIRNIKLVREMHANAAEFKNPTSTIEKLNITFENRMLSEAVRADLQHVDISQAPLHLLKWTPQLAVSQFDMVLTQFCFFGIAYLFPKQVGVSDPEGLEGFLHIWAVIGRHLGIEDRFNLALNPDPHTFHKIFTNIFVVGLKDLDETVIAVQESMMKEIDKRFPPSTAKSLLYSGLKVAVPGFQGKNIYALMTLHDRFAANMLRLITGVVGRFPWFRDLTNYVVKKRLIAITPWAFPSSVFKNL